MRRATCAESRYSSRRSRTWADAVYPDPAYFNVADRGGHFAGWEEPGLFSTEVRAAFRALRPRGSASGIARGTDGEAVNEDLRRAQRHIEEAVNDLHGHPDPDGVLADARALLTKAAINLRAYVPEPVLS